MNIEYQLYLADIKKLARTLLIKSVGTAEAINNFIRLQYGDEYVDESDQTSWKYYKNICGEYHTLDTDMKVVSWDTGDTISFTKANLAIHTKTRSAYEYGTTQYKDLLKKYPNQEMLIKGILYPAVLADALSEVDGKILAYPKELIEENEYSLINKLDNWIAGYKIRWYNEQFEYSDNLYLATNLGIMYLNLVPAILLFRLEACKTNEAHSFHIKSYLTSHGISADVVRYLTKKQALFFYRNIKYILRNAGKIETFNLLVEHIMTERYLPLSGYTLVHDDETQLEDLVPKALFSHESLNKVYQSSVEPYIETSDLLGKEVELNPGNSSYIEEMGVQIDETCANSIGDRLITKVLESSVVDYEDTGQLSLETQLMNYWLYFSTNGYYTNLVRIQNSKTGEYISLRAKEAYILALYCFAKTIGWDLLFVPSIMPAIRIARIPTPTLDDLLSVCDLKYVDQSIIASARDSQPIVVPFTSTTDFASKVVQLTEAAKYQKKLMALPEHEYSRALTEAAISRLYHDVECKLVETQISYESWLSERTIILDSFERVDYALLYKSIVKDAIGKDFAEENTLAGIHTAMITLFKQLSSYSIQFVRQFSGSELVSMEYIMTRLGDYHNEGKSEVVLPTAYSEIQGLAGEGSALIPIDVTPTELREILETKGKNEISLDIGIDVDWNITPLIIEGHLPINVGIQSIEIITQE